MFAPGDKLTISEVGGKRMVKICSIGHPFQYMSSSNTLVVSLHVARRGHGVYFNYTMLPSDQLVPGMFLLNIYIPSLSNIFVFICFILTIKCYEFLFVSYNPTTLNF